MEKVKYDVFFVTTRCVLNAFLNRALLITVVCLFVAYSLTWGSILYRGEWNGSEQ